MKNLTTSEDIFTFVKDHSIVAVKFYNDNCAPCKMLSPILEAMEEKLGNTVHWAEANVSNEDLQEAMKQYKVRSPPTVCVFEHGTLVGRLVGANVQGPLQTLLDELIREETQ